MNSLPFRHLSLFAKYHLRPFEGRSIDRIKTNMDIMLIRSLHLNRLELYLGCIIVWFQGGGTDGRVIQDELSEAQSNNDSLKM